MVIPMNTCQNKTLVMAGQAITKGYDNEQIIRDINVELFYGELVSLLGVSGVGKTTVFNILSGLERPDSGIVRLYGKDITGSSGHVSYMQQKDLLLPFRTIIDNVCVPLRLRGISKKQARAEAAEYFGEFGLTGCEHKYPVQLSGGMRQRAALLRSYLFNDQIMLMDEPFSALDAITKTSMHKWFQTISKKHHTSSFFITHDIDEAIVLSDRIYIISGCPGQISDEIHIEYNGIRDELFTTSDLFINYKRKIMEKYK